MTTRTRLAIMLLALAATAVLAGEPPERALDANTPRPVIPSVFKWDLGPLSTSDQVFEQEGQPPLARHEGGLGAPTSLAASLDPHFRVHRDASFLRLYANLRERTAQTDKAAAAMGRKSLAAIDDPPNGWLELLEGAGVDLTRAEPIGAVMRVVGCTLFEVEIVLQQQDWHWG